MIEAAVALFAAHVLADYVLQTARMVANKAKPAYLLYHTSVVLMTAIALTGSIHPAIFALSGAHLLIDFVKTRSKQSIQTHLIDQIAHLVTIAIVVVTVPTLWQHGIWANAPTWVSHAILLVAGIIYATRAGGFVVGILMAPYGNEFSKGSLPGGGMMIGILERGLIFILILSNEPIGIGFLIAAKSVLRFETAKDGDTAENRKRSEYIIIGTLASFGWAILVSLAIIMLQAQLEPLGIARPTP
jgi:hypothetical protein